MALRGLLFALAVALCLQHALCVPFAYRRHQEPNGLDDVDMTFIDDMMSKEAKRVDSFEKEEEKLPGNENLRRGVALMLVRKILLQGDILREKQKVTLDRMVSGNKALTCKACQVGVTLIQKIFNSDVGEAVIADVAVIVCHALKIEDNRVCLMAVDEFKDMVFYLIFNLKSDELCYWGLNMAGKTTCPKPEGFLPEWNITLPGGAPSRSLQAPPTPGGLVSKFLFFTDMHMDVRYKAGSDAVCGEPLCCRDNDETPSNDVDKAWSFGDYRSCDMPQWTVDGMMGNLDGEPIDFIVYTGDIPAHDVWNQTSEDQMDKIDRWTATLKKYFPHAPIYSSLGNHESAPVNSYPPHSIFDQPGANITWLYQAAYDSWSNWIPEDDLATVLQGGFYTTLVRKGVRVVSLNTNLCSDDSWWLLVGDNSVDPEGQLSWFAQVMQEAEDNNEKVFIISHRPTSGCMKSWSYSYYDIINRYQNSIIAQLFGHAHTDELNLYYDVDAPSRVAATALIGPAFTTYSYKNAGYRIYTMDGDYDGTSNMLLDGESYFLNISDANIKGEQKWSLEYSFSKDYQMKNLSPEEFQRLVDRFDDDDDLFQLYYQHISKSQDMSYCDAGCKQSTICSIKHFRAGDDSFCS